MGNYTQLTQFTPKDALAPGNPLKTIFGALFDPEFAAISTAITSKPSTGGPAVFTGITGTSITGTSIVNTGTESTGNVNVTANTLPANGIYLPAANTLGFATNTTVTGAFGPTGGLFLGAATGGDQGPGTINATSVLQNGVQVSQYYKSALAALFSNSTTTLTTVNTFSTCALVPGTYLIQTRFLFQNASSTGSGYQWKFVFGGTFVPQLQGLVVQSSNGVVTTALASPALITSASIASAGTFDVSNYEIVAICTVGGNLTVQMAQANANAFSTNLLAGSTLIVTRII